jgi:transmembrane protein
MLGGCLEERNMPPIIASLVRTPLFLLAARLLVTFPYWSSGLSKTLRFDAGVAEMTLYGLHPPVVFNIAVIACMFLGSILVIVNRFAWLGAGALAVFTLLTIPIVHHFWTMTGAQAETELFFVVEHIGLIGGLMLATILSQRTDTST